MNSQINNTRENIHTGLSGLKDDNKWSEMLNMRSANRRTKAVRRKHELFTRDAGFHSLFRGLKNKCYVIGTKESFGFVGSDTLCPFKLWRVDQRYLGTRNDRSPSTQRLLIRGNFTGTVPKKFRVTLVKGRLVADFNWPEEPEAEAVVDDCFGCCPLDSDELTITVTFYIYGDEYSETSEDILMTGSVSSGVFTGTTMLGMITLEWSEANTEWEIYFNTPVSTIGAASTDFYGTLSTGSAIRNNINGYYIDLAAAPFPNWVATIPSAT